MIDNLVRDLRVLRKAESLIGRIWVTVIARRIGLLAFAGLISVFGLAMGNVAGFYALQPSVGPVWAAAIASIVDFALTAIVMLLARSAAPGPELDLALEVRTMAVEAIQADAGDLKATIEALGREIREARDSIVGFAHNPLDAAAQKLLIPAAISLIKGLRSRKTEG